MAENTFSGSVDDILKGLKNKQAEVPQDQKAVEEILTGLGIQDGTPDPAGTVPPPPADPDPEYRPEPEEADGQEEPVEIPLPLPEEPTAEFTAPAAGEQEEPSAPSAPQAEEQTVAVDPGLGSTGTIQFDDEFQRFFSQSIAVVNDEEPEQHPGFFARFLQRRQDSAEDECEENAEPLIDSEPDGVSYRVPDEEETAAPEQKKPSLAEKLRSIRLKKPDLSALPRLFGRENAEEQPFAEQEPREYLNDYENPEDAPHVQADLGKMRAGLLLRVMVSAVLSVILLYMGLAVGDSILPPFSGLDPYVEPAAYLSVQMLLLAVVGAVNWRVFYQGIPGLWKTPTQDTMPAMAAIGAMLQLLTALVNTRRFDPAEITVFAGAASVLLLCNAVGRLIMSDVVLRNFQMLSGGDRVAASLVQDREITEKIGKEMQEPEPCLLINRPAGLIRGFLSHSFSHRSSDNLARKFSWVLLGGAVLSTLVCAFTGLGSQLAMAAFAGTLCLGAPAAATLLSAVPTLLMQKSAARVGAVVPGWSAVSQLGQVNMVVAEAKDLFPTSSVRLHGIKTFEKQRIDLAILYAASVLIRGCDTLKEVFMDIIQGREDILFPVENLENHPGRGFTAWLDNNRVIVGNRQMMQEQGVEIPSRDYESRYTKGKYLPIYLAVSGHVFGMFMVSYRRNKQVAATLATLRRQGVSVLVHSDDFCLKSNLVAQIYHLPQESIKVLSVSERKTLEPLTRYAARSEGCMSHLGSFSSFVGGMIAAAGAAAGERTASLVQAAGIVISCVLSLMLAFTGGIAQLSLGAVILYSAVWGVLTLTMPLFRSY